MSEMVEIPDNQPSQEYVDSLLKEIAKRDAIIEKERKNIADYKSAYESKAKQLKELEDKYNKLYKDRLPEQLERKIKDLEQRLTEMTVRASTYSTGTGVLLRDADTRRKELALLKARVETIAETINVFLAEERAIRETNQPRQDVVDSILRFDKIVTDEEDQQGEG